jgi:hypothetical protein
MVATTQRLRGNPQKWLVVESACAVKRLRRIEKEIQNRGKSSTKARQLSLQKFALTGCDRGSNTTL